MALLSGLQLHTEKVINQRCLLLRAFPAQEEEEGQAETWLGDECPHFYAFQKYSLSMRNGAACIWAEGKLPFPLTCSQG